jgi:hypothetical protein
MGRSARRSMKLKFIVALFNYHCGTLKFDVKIIVALDVLVWCNLYAMYFFRFIYDGNEYLLWAMCLLCLSMKNQGNNQCYEVLFWASLCYFFMLSRLIYV